ncbi:hypothetical protein ACES2L_05190 [Bdellovibrio bacteriovorus]
MKTLFVLMLSLFTTIAFARTPDTVKPGEPLCYGREYSEKHMSSRPKQTVKMMKLKFYITGEPPYTSLALAVDAKIKRPVKPDPSENSEETTEFVYKDYTTLMFCEKTGSGKLRCGVECDGGTADIRWSTSNPSKGATLKNNGFVMHGGCGEEDDPIYLTPTPKGDDVFNLVPLPKEFCQE